LHDGRPVVVRLPEIDSIDHKAGKPVGIQKFIGRRPVAASGNSDGHLQMLRWTIAGDGSRFGGSCITTIQSANGAYDRESHIGRLDQALDLVQLPPRTGSSYE
jgi:hypothetical protein